MNRAAMARIPDPAPRQDAPDGPGPDRRLRDALGRFATGVTVVTAPSARGPLGITANSFSSVSLDPPLVLWCPARRSRRFETFAGAPRYAIHILGTDQAALCRRFAGDGLDFDGIPWQTGEDGVPLIEGCLARFDCRQVSRLPAGDHDIVVGEVLSHHHRDGEPLLFSAGLLGRFADGL